MKKDNPSNNMDSENCLLEKENALKSFKRKDNFKTSFERFLVEYRLDRIADTHDFLENDPEYKKIHLDKEEKENALQSAIKEGELSMALLNYFSIIDRLIDYVKTIFYEHGFLDCATIYKVMKEGLDGMDLHTLL